MSTGIKAQHRGATFGPGIRASWAQARAEAGTLSHTSGRTFWRCWVQDGGLHDEDSSRPLATTRGRSTRVEGHQCPAQWNRGGEVGVARVLGQRVGGIRAAWLTEGRSGRVEAGSASSHGSFE